MSARSKHAYTDWVFGGVMLVLCVVLTVLQYHWTGEVARAEMTRLRGNLAEQAQALMREFESELSGSCDQLTPVDSDASNLSFEAAHVARFRAWQATKPRPIFSRIAFAGPAGNQVQLSMLDQATGHFVRTNWPKEWAMMYAALNQKAQGGPPPSYDQRGLLLEFPVFGGSGPGGEHWLVLEIDLNYLCEHWLPELAAKYLNPSGRVVNDVRVTMSATSSDVLFATTNDLSGSREGVVSVRLNRLGRTSRRSDLPGQTTGLWQLETWPRPGALEATVAASRRRNLSIAVCINLLMFATGIALVHNTRRSRKLAEQQMNFVAGVSHELRTPLTVIRGAAHNMKRGVVHEPKQIERYSSLIIEHTDQLTEMIEQVLTFAGAQKGRAVSVRQPVALANVLNEAVAATAYDARVARCKVELELAPVLPVIIGDAAALRRVFQNLITNAAKHGGRGGWIGITASSDEESTTPIVEIQVADRGPGIPTHEQTDIFKPFFRGAAAQAGQVRGSGLGLSLIREIVEAHGGTVSVRSVNGSGATFIVRLPASAETQIK